MHKLTSCNHPQVTCINPYEIIRKYKCESCGAVMMCACEEEFARHFLPHQLREGTELQTRRRIPVTLGFQPNICNTCHGLPEDAHPKAEIYGACSKIRRYYWREIIFQTTKRFADWAVNEGYKDYEIALRERRDEREKIEKLFIEEIKDFHNRTPKYTFQEEAQSEVLAKNKVEIVNLAGIYTKTEDGKLGILVGGRPCSAEEFTGEHYSQRGYQILTTESIPFHVLFGTFMWLLIQDPIDPLVRIVGFGDRASFDERRSSQQIWTHLPEDFATPGYATRRDDAIKKHFESIPHRKEELLWLFDYWIEPSSGLRQYLWAHRSSDIERTHQLIQILSVDEICRVLKYIDNPLRRKIQPPSEMPLRHNIEPGMTVLDVGPGNGRYTIETARRVGHTGRVIAIDIEPKMIERVTHRAQVEGVTNLEAKIANVYNLPFEDATFDAIYMITVIGEIPQPEWALREFYRVLKPSGTIAFSEALMDPDYPLAQTLIRKASKAKFRLKKRVGNLFAYTLVFEKQQDAA